MSKREKTDLRFVGEQIERLDNLQALLGHTNREQLFVSAVTLLERVAQERAEGRIILSTDDIGDAPDRDLIIIE